MGLDMYFYQTKKNVLPAPQEREVIYFRKFNALHGYIIQNITKGVDDCDWVVIDKEQLTTLVKILKKVNKTRKLAEELLPTYPGFFFGTYDYDDFYFKDLVHAIKELSKILKWLKASDDNELLYLASW